MNRLFAAGVVVVALSTLACDDKTEATPQAPTAPVAVVTPGVVDARAVLGLAAIKQRTQVCLAYQRERTKLNSALAKAPTDTTIQRKALSLASIITDACN